MVSVCSVNAVGGQCLISWCDGVSVCDQFVWWGIIVCSVDVIRGLCADSCSS